MLESLQVRGIIINSADTVMIMTGSDLSWGQWIHSPVNVNDKSSSTFACQDRAASPSGTEGWATWKIGDAKIKITFDASYRGSNSQSITCSPKGAYKVTCSDRAGSLNKCTFRVMPAE